MKRPKYKAPSVTVDIVDRSTSNDNRTVDIGLCYVAMQEAIHRYNENQVVTTQPGWSDGADAEDFLYTTRMRTNQLNECVLLSLLAGIRKDRRTVAADYSGKAAVMSVTIGAGQGFFEIEVSVYRVK